MTQDFGRLGLSKWQMHGLFLGAVIGLCDCYISIKNTMIRKETFARNLALLEERYGEIHGKEVGGKLNKYGYPDIGNNLYSELLPYKDWVRVNNAQRCHENLVGSLIILYPNAFIGLLAFPKTTIGLLYAFLVLRAWHIKGYLSFRGNNKAVAAEEFSKLMLIVMVGVAFTASLRILGAGPIFRKLLPKRF